MVKNRSKQSNIAAPLDPAPVPESAPTARRAVLTGQMDEIVSPEPRDFRDGTRTTLACRVCDDRTGR